MSPVQRLSPAKKLKLGVVFTLTLLLLLVMMINAEFIRGIFTPKAALYAFFPTVGGLREGSPVWLLGIEIGRVEKIELQSDGVLVKLLIQRTAVDFVMENSQAVILTMGLAGYKYIGIKQNGPPAAPAMPGDTIAGVMPMELEQVIEASVNSARLVEAFLSRLDTLIRNIESGKGTIGALLQDRTLYENIEKVTAVMAQAATQYQRGRSTFRQLVSNDSLYRQMAVTVTMLQELTRRVSRGEGSLARLINDPHLYANLNTSADRLQALIDDLSADSSAVRMLSSAQFAANLLQATVQLNELLADIKRNPKRYFSVSIF